MATQVEITVRARVILDQVKELRESLSEVDQQIDFHRSRLDYNIETRQTLEQDIKVALADFGAEVENSLHNITFQVGDRVSPTALVSFDGEALPSDRTLASLGVIEKIDEEGDVVVNWEPESTTSSWIHKDWMSPNNLRLIARG